MDELTDREKRALLFWAGLSAVIAAAWTFLGVALGGAPGTALVFLGGATFGLALAFSVLWAGLAWKGRSWGEGE